MDDKIEKAPEQTPKFTEQKVRQDKIWKSVALIVVCAVVFTAVGYYAGQNNPKQENAAEATKTTDLSSIIQTKTTTAPASATADITADWKTYKDDTYGFSFKYPSNWTFKAGDGNACQSIGYITSPETKVEYDKFTSEGPKGDLPITLSDISFSYCTNIQEADGNNPKKWTSFSDMINDAGYYHGQEKMTFAGQSAYSVIEGGLLDYYTILLEKDGHIYRIGFGNRDSREKVSTTENQILSTFQFTK